MKITKGYTFDDVLLVPKYSEIKSRNDVDLKVNLGTEDKPLLLDIPIICANMKSTAGLVMVEAIAKLGGLGLLHRFMEYDTIVNTFKYSKAELRNRIGCSVGVQDKDRTLVDKLVDAGCKIICIDIANAFSKIGIDMTEYIAKKYSEVIIISGNVSTGKAALSLYDAGATICKIGQGGGCFGKGTRILLSNGTCKNIEDIIPGDRIINKDGNPVAVKNIIMTGIKKVVKIRHDLAVKETFVTPDHKYWVGDCNTMNDNSWKDGDIVKKLDLLTKKDQSKYKWKPVEEIKKDCFLMPNLVNWELNETFSIDILKRAGGNGIDNIVNKIDVTLTPNYDLGYIFGTFLGDGNALQAEYEHSKIGAVNWYFGLNELDIVKKLNNCIKNIFNKELSIVKKESIYLCRLYYKPLADCLASFGKKDKKHLPSNFIVNNRDYLSGILDGLIDSDGHIESSGRKRFTNTSEQLIELTSFLSYIFNGTFTSNGHNKATAGGLKNCNIENCKDGYSSSIHATAFKKLTKNYQVSQIRKIEQIETEIPVYDIEVDDETHSFIADYAIVHNSLCSTRIETGNGVPSMTSLEDVYKASLSVNRKFKIIADGGLRNSGAITKGLCFSDAVMLGSLLAGTDEAPSELMMIEGKKYKTYAGSSTFKTDYVEGVSGVVPYVGPVAKIIEKLMQGLRSGCSYQGVSNLEDLKKDPEFVSISNSGLIESHPHDVKIL